MGPVECRWRPSRPRQNHRQRPPRPWVRPHLQARRSERIAPLQETPAQTVASAGASGEQSTAVQQIDPSSGGGTRCDSGHLTAAGAQFCGTCGIPMAAGQTATATPSTTATPATTQPLPRPASGNDGHPRQTHNPRRTDNNNPGCGHVRWATQRCPANPSPPGGGRDSIRDSSRRWLGLAIVAAVLVLGLAGALVFVLLRRNRRHSLRLRRPSSRSPPGPLTTRARRPDPRRQSQRHSSMNNRRHKACRRFSARVSSTEARSTRPQRRDLVWPLALPRLPNLRHGLQPAAEPHHTAVRPPGASAFSPEMIQSLTTRGRHQNKSIRTMPTGLTASTKTVAFRTTLPTRTTRRQLLRTRRHY